MDFNADLNGFFKAPSKEITNTMKTTGIQQALDAVARAKLQDAFTHEGLVVGFDQDEAEAAGAFPESAVTLEDAQEAQYDVEG